MEKLYNEKKAELIKILFNSTTFDIDIQPELDQVAVWCESFDEHWSICFQNGDMNGDNIGTAIWTNDGADDGFYELLKILEKKPEFQCLIDDDTYHSDVWLRELIDDFIREYAEKENIDQHFEA